MYSEKTNKVVEFLEEIEKNLNKLESEREDLLQYQEELEDAHDIDDDDERSDAIDEAERNHSQCFDNIEYLEKEISENFTIDVAKDLIPFVRKLLKYTSSIQHRLDSLAYDARELSDENELDDVFDENWSNKQSKFISNNESTKA